MTPEKHDKKLTRWLLMATIVLLVLVLCLQLWQMFGRTASGNARNDPPLTQDASNPNNPQLEQLWETGAPGLPIGVSAAAQAAGEYAGTLAVDSVTSETDPELDEAPAHYEVELHHPTLGDFEYKIDAYTGEVLEGLPDVMGSSQAAAAPQTVPDASPKTQTPAAQAPASTAQTPSSGTQSPAAGTPAATGEEAAKSAAFTHAGVSAADAESLRCKLDWDDGRQVYDIEFWVGTTEYDYEIDASTNAVLEAKQEQNSHRSGTAAQQSGGFIGEEAAKSAALTHAGVSADDAGYVKCELDENDGYWVYELEFRVGSVEYDYEIDASSGAVVKAEQGH